MPKNIVQDVVPRGRKTIRDIPLSGATEAEEPREVSRHTIHAEYREEESTGWENKPSGFGFSSKWLLWIIGVVSVGVLIVVLGNSFSSAEITITPKTASLKINLDLTASPKVSDGSISYKSFSDVKEKEVAIPSDGEKQVETRASGKIIIYNNYSTASQRLIKNTRFETPDGLIYKIQDSVTIPGRHIVSGQVLPGSIEVFVFAESTGKEYNIGLTDFTIPGFKSNAERFSKFFARSKTPMAGGFVGKAPSVSDEKKLSGKAQLEADLTAELVAEAKTNLPKDYIFASNSYKIAFDVLPESANGNAPKNSVLLRERARFTAFFLKQDETASAFAKEYVFGFDGAQVEIADVSQLVFVLKNNEDFGTASIVGPIQFNLKGRATIVWAFDQSKLKAELLGKNKNELNGIVSRYKAVVKVDVVSRPFWKSVFPSSASKIKIVTKELAQ